jgi:hypothetical protein
MSILNVVLVLIVAEAIVANGLISISRLNGTCPNASLPLSEVNFTEVGCKDCVGLELCVFSKYSSFFPNLSVLFSKIYYFPSGRRNLVPLRNGPRRTAPKPNLHLPQHISIQHNRQLRRAIAE